jgi:hypothetical protein
MRPIELRRRKVRTWGSENRRRPQLIRGVEVPCGRHWNRNAGFDHYADLRGAAVPAKRCAVFNQGAALGTGMFHGSQGIAGRRREARSAWCPRFASLFWTRTWDIDVRCHEEGLQSCFAYAVARKSVTPVGCAAESPGASSAFAHHTPYQMVSLSPPRVCTKTSAKSVPFPFSCGEMETMCWLCLVPTLSSSVFPVEFSQLS